MVVEKDKCINCPAQEKCKPDIKKKDKEWFYTKTVKEHFFHPKNLLTRPPRKGDFNGVGEVGSPACGDVMKMWILVKDDKIKKCKWLTFGSLISGEPVLMPNFISKKVDDITINSIIFNENNDPVVVEENLKRHYTGKILNMQLSTSKFYNFSVTPNHPIPCFERDKISKVIRKSDKRWSEIDNKKLQKQTPILKSASQLKSGDFLIFKINKKVVNNNKLDNDFCKLLGYYVSDGSSPSTNRVIFYFGLNEYEYIKDIEKVLKKRRWAYKIYRRNTENVICLQLNESKIVNLLRVHGGLPGKKNFSNEVMLLPAKKQMIIADSYINGDGWVTKQNENWEETCFISTSKENLAYQLQVMLARNLIFAPIHWREPRKFVIRGKSYKNSGEINLIFRKKVRRSRIKYHKNEHAFLIPIQTIQVSDYRGKIYDIGLSKDPKIYKVKGISVHNCASAIASTSMLSLMVTEKGGMLIENAKKITPQDILKRLGGLPSIKIHCSVLGDQALRAAIEDYLNNKNNKK